MRDGHPSPTPPRTPRGRRFWPRQGRRLRPRDGSESRVREDVSKMAGEQRPGPEPPGTESRPWAPKATRSKLPGKQVGSCSAQRGRGESWWHFACPLPCPRGRHPPPQFPLLPGGQEEWEPALAGVGVPVGPEVSPDSGTAHWGPGCNRACKSGWRTTGARGREPRGAGRFLPWFSGNWAGQDGKVLELARTM